jgi:hypothetical protein
VTVRCGSKWIAPLLNPDVGVDHRCVRPRGHTGKHICACAVSTKPKDGES